MSSKLNHSNLLSRLIWSYCEKVTDIQFDNQLRFGKGVQSPFNGVTFKVYWLLYRKMGGLQFARALYGRQPLNFFCLLNSTQRTLKNDFPVSFYRVSRAESIFCLISSLIVIGNLTKHVQRSSCILPVHVEYKCYSCLLDLIAVLAL